MNKATLSEKMTVSEFDNGYWYATDLKRFAKRLGVPSAGRLRKDELEEIVRHFLKHGSILDTYESRRRGGANPSEKDSANGLKLSQRIVNYCNDPTTKKFIYSEAARLDPGFKKKSGAMYRLNRWREEQIAAKLEITYGDLVEEYVRLCQVEGSFPQIPSGRYINFLANYLNGEPNSTHAQAIAAWHELKILDIPKTYSAWKNRLDND